MYWDGISPVEKRKWNEFRYNSFKLMVHIKASFKEVGSNHPCISQG